MDSILAEIRALEERSKVELVKARERSISQINQAKEKISQEEKKEIRDIESASEELIRKKKMEMEKKKQDILKQAQKEAERLIAISKKNMPAAIDLMIRSLENELS